MIESIKLTGINASHIMDNHSRGLFTYKGTKASMPPKYDSATASFLRLSVNTHLD